MVSTNCERRVVEDIVNMHDNKVSAWRGIQMYLMFIANALSISSNIIGNSFLNTAGFVTLNIVGNKLEQAAYGIAISYYSMFSSSLITSSLDKYGIDLSHEFGKGNFGGMKQVTTKSILSLILVLGSFTMPLLLFSHSVLLSVGIREDIALLASSAIRLLMVLAVLQMTNETIKTFCISQGHEKVFAVPEYINISLSIVFLYYLVCVRKMSIKGWIYSRITNEVVNLVILSSVMYLRTDKRSRGVASVKEVWGGLGAYFCDTLKFIMGSYTEYLAFEVTTYFVALTKDPAQIAAYTGLINVSVICYCVGISFALICRTRVSILAGMGRQDVAISFFRTYYWFTVFIGCCLGAVGYLYRDSISGVYASSDREMRETFKKLLTIFCVFMPAECSLMTATITMKSIGKIKLLVALNVVILLVCNTVGCGFLYWYDRTTCIYYFISIMSVLLLLNIVCRVLCGLRNNWYDEAIPVSPDHLESSINDREVICDGDTEDVQ